MFEDFMTSEAKKPTSNSPQEPPCERTERFRVLWAMFKKGSEWINQEYETHILPDGKRHYDPHLETQIKRFDDEVMKPMDILWSEMTDRERSACDPMKHQFPETP